MRLYVISSACMRIHGPALVAGAFRRYICIFILLVVTFDHFPIANACRCLTKEISYGASKHSQHNLDVTFTKLYCVDRLLFRPIMTHIWPVENKSRIFT